MERSNNWKCYVCWNHKLSQLDVTCKLSCSYSFQWLVYKSDRLQYDNRSFLLKKNQKFTKVANADYGTQCPYCFVYVCSKLHNLYKHTLKFIAWCYDFESTWNPQIMEICMCDIKGAFHGEVIASIPLQLVFVYWPYELTIKNLLS